MRIYLTSLILLTLFSCSSVNEKNKNLLVGDIKIDGSSTVYPVTEAIAEEFRLIQPNVRVTVGVSGPGGGFKKFARGATNISNASRPIKNSNL